MALRERMGREASPSAAVLEDVCVQLNGLTEAEAPDLPALVRLPKLLRSAA